MNSDLKDNLTVAVTMTLVIATISLSLLAGIWIQAWRDVEVAKIKATQKEVAE